MQFFLKMGFGLINSSYRRKEDDPYVELIQWRESTSAAWSTVSTVIMATYKDHGHSASFQAAWLGLVLTTAALLYIDDTDLLHMTTTQQTPTL